MIKEGGAMCGGVVSKSTFNSDPWAYMMAYYMDDDKFELYKTAKQQGNAKEADKLFNKFARSAI